MNDAVSARRAMVSKARNGLPFGVPRYKVSSDFQGVGIRTKTLERQKVRTKRSEWCLTPLRCSDDDSLQLVAARDRGGRGAPGDPLAGAGMVVVAWRGRLRPIRGRRQRLVWVLVIHTRRRQRYGSFIWSTAISRFLRRPQSRSESDPATNLLRSPSVRADHAHQTPRRISQSTR